MLNLRPKDKPVKNFSPFFCFFFCSKKPLPQTDWWTYERFSHSEMGVCDTGSGDWWSNWWNKKTQKTGTEDSSIYQFNSTLVEDKGKRKAIIL